MSYLSTAAVMIFKAIVCSAIIFQFIYSLMDTVVCLLLCGHVLSSQNKYKKLLIIYLGRTTRNAINNLHVPTITIYNER